METGAGTIILTPNFVHSAQEIGEYIATNSVKNAENFSDGLRPRILEIKKMPEAHPLVRQINPNPGMYRYTKYMKSFKIFFKVLPGKLVFLDIQHQSRGDKVVKKIIKIAHD
jgi:hypothetical protein